MKKKNVLHILRTYSLHGGEKQLSKILIKNDFFKNTFLDLYYDKKIRNFYHKKKIKYLSLNNFYFKPANLLIEILMSFLSMFSKFYKISKILRNEEIQIVVCHGIQSAIAVQLVCLFFKKKISFYYMHRIVKKYRPYDLFSKIIYANFKNILCNSIAVKKSLYPYCKKKKLKVIYNAVETVDNKKFKNKKNIILSVARLEKRKNIIFLINSFNNFNYKNKNYYLYILGDGTERENLINYVKKNDIKNIKFLGYRENIKNYFSKAKIFVHTSLFEGMSNSVLEAMSYGIPTVVLDAPGVSELHIHFKTGIISKNNPEKFANYLDLLVNNQNLQKKFFYNSRKRVQTKYSFRETIKSYYRYLI